MVKDGLVMVPDMTMVKVKFIKFTATLISTMIQANKVVDCLKKIETYSVV